MLKKLTFSLSIIFLFISSSCFCMQKQNKHKELSPQKDINAKKSLQDKWLKELEDMGYIYFPCGNYITALDDNIEDFDTEEESSLKNNPY